MYTSKNKYGIQQDVTEKERKSVLRKLISYLSIVITKGRKMIKAQKLLSEIGFKASFLLHKRVSI